MADELSTIKPDGLRNDADRKVFFNNYNDLKNTAAQIQYEQDPWKKAQLKSNIDQKLLELNDYALQSKQQGLKEKAFASAALAHHDNWTDDAYKLHSASTELPVNDPNLIKDYNLLERKPDPTKVMKFVGDGESTMLGGVIPEEYTRNIPGPGKKLVKEAYYKREVTTQAALKMYSDMYDANPDLSATLKRSNPDILAQGLSPEETKAALIGWFEKQRRAGNNLLKTEKSGNITYTPPKQTTNINLGKDDSTFAQKAVAGIMNGDHGAINAIQSYLPQGSKIEHLTSQENPGVSKGGYNLVRIHVPPHIKQVNGSDVTIPGHDEDVPLATGDPKNRLNALISQYTPLKTNPSKFNTVGGKSRGNEIQIHAPVQAGDKSMFNVDGRIYNIPEEKQAAFLNHFKNAKKIKGTNQRLW